VNIFILQFEIFNYSKELFYPRTYLSLYAESVRSEIKEISNFFKDLFLTKLLKTCSIPLFSIGFLLKFKYSNLHGLIIDIKASLNLIIPISSILLLEISKWVMLV